MIINCIWEHNGDDTLLHIENYIGAFTRGKNLDIAISKVKAEIINYCGWIGITPPEEIKIQIVQEHDSSLSICDADTDVLFESEKKPLIQNEYETLKELCLILFSDKIL